MAFIEWKRLLEDYERDEKDRLESLVGNFKKHFHITREEIEEEAELLLRFLVEINAEKSDELLNNFVFYKLKFTQPGSKRKLKGMFGSAFDPEKEKKYKPNVTLKSFRAYVFGLRSGVTEKPDPGWDILKEEDIGFLKDIISREANIIDGV